MYHAFIVFLVLLTHIEDPVTLLKGKKEIDGLRIKATVNDVEAFALLALKQLVEDESLGLIEHGIQHERTQDYVKGIIESIKSDLAKALGDAIPKVDAIVQLGDEIAQVGKVTNLLLPVLTVTPGASVPQRRLAIGSSLI